MVTTIPAAGAVLWRPSHSDGRGNGTEIALVHRPRYDDWTLPKGKLDAGESIYAAAVREVAEETGFTSVLCRHLAVSRYQVSTPRTGRKVVAYFSARAVSGSFSPNDEVDDLRWVSPSAAAGLLSYQRDQPVLAAFRAAPTDTTTLLLVRHAKAGNRADWSGNDDERPLTTEGRAQARALRALLPLFGVDRLHAAPRTRCVQTVAGLAKDLHTEVILEPRLSEEGFHTSAWRSVARLREIAAAGGTAAVVSQGGAIPGLVTALSAGSAVGLSRVEARKGSVWVLTFAGPDLVAAHYIASP